MSADTARISPQRAGVPILAVEDEAGILDLYERLILDLRHKPLRAGTAAEARRLFERYGPPVVLLDVVLPDGDGLDLLRNILSRAPQTRVLVITGHATVDMAVEAMRLGAYDYVSKPFGVEKLKERISEALKVGTEPPQSYDIVGISPAMERVRDLIRMAAACDSTVLIEGASGTGKELVARRIHQHSRRAAEPFVPVDCGAIAPTLMESELFGHVAGAFTDARSAHDGLFRAAGAGTVFLDEIGELPAQVQAKLLRALQNREIRPVGSSRIFTLEARVIAATNRNLSQEVELGRFRRDLFYRLHVIPITIPPLAKRPEDIPVLVEHLLERFSARMGRSLRISPGALRGLMSYPWPGNVRELENAIERAFAFIQGEVIEEENLPLLLPEYGKVTAPTSAGNGGLPSLEEQEREAIRAALAKTGGNKREAARLLGIGVATLYRKLRRFGIAQE